MLSHYIASFEGMKIHKYVEMIAEESGIAIVDMNNEGHTNIF